MQHLLLLIVTMSACVASAMHIEKRANKLICNTPASCESYYNTGSAQCANGYELVHLEAPGFSPGSTCQKACDDSERKQCGAKQCTDSKDYCNIYPGSETCASAIIWCGTPIKTTKDNCVQLRMRQPVKYDDAAGTCAADPDAPKDNHFFDLPSAGAQSVIAKMKKVSQLCGPDMPGPLTLPGIDLDLPGIDLDLPGIDLNLPGIDLDLPGIDLDLPKIDLDLPKIDLDLPKIDLDLPKIDLDLPGIPNTTPYKIEWSCHEGENKYDNLKQVFKNACAIAAHPGNAAPTFESYVD
ncbi:hypothetical protein EKO04_006298 [Ascochyta lentis]|uniref:Uncharacterized protein n=1 Tax=Ascochyta lentis TaxID=205686 RepID=A0A8H7MIA3_9PLEO|nr:hypothetical protein EKO04_006298 [Ascochyta lentis]